MSRKDYLGFRRISFDREEIRKNVFKLPYREACRSKYPIYRVLLKELYEDYCLVTAKYFEYLVNVEDKLINESVIRDRVSHKPKLLFGLYDLCKTAELIVLGDPKYGKSTCTRLLLQCLHICDNYRVKYAWFVQEMHQIITKVCGRIYNENEKNLVGETHCMIVYKTAQLMVKKDMFQAVKLFQKAFELAQGTHWTILEGDCADNYTLSSTSKVISKTLASTLLQNAYNIAQTDPSQAIKNAEHTLYSMAKGNIGSHNVLFLLAYLDLAYFYMEAGRFEEAINSLDQVKQRLDTSSVEDELYLKTMCKYYHFQGICYNRLNRKDLALRYLLDCVAFSRKTKLQEFEARSLLHLAKVYTSLGAVQSKMAEKCLEEARVVFAQLNDNMSIAKCKFVQAKTKSLIVYPMVYDLIRQWRAEPCDRYRLLEWKNRCFPFWNNIHKMRILEEVNPMKCVILRHAEYAILSKKPNNFRRQQPQL